jgi:thiol-disulfide isomerase/thioredoxin
LILATKRATICVFLLTILLFADIVFAADTLEDFSLTTLDGETINTEELRGTPLVITVMATWCTPCKKEAPYFQKAYEAYREEEVAFLAVFIGSNEKNIRKFIRKYGDLTFPAGRDSSGAAKQFGSSAIPITVYVSREGEIRRKRFGPSRYEDIVEGIEEILK